MADQTITLFRADTGAAVNSIADLRESIKALKQDLEGMEIGSEEYADTLSQLQTQQAALKNALHATTASLSDVARDAKALNVTFDEQNQVINDGTITYNALVKKMAELDQQFRSTSDAAERAALGQKINSINDALKQLDADRGKFGRNVGDYFNQITAPLKSVIQDLPSGLGGLKKVMDDTTKSLSLMGKQPILGILGLLAPVINQIVAGLKDNKTALDAVKRVMEAMQPVFDFLQGVLEKIAGLFSQVVDWVLEFADQHKEAFKNFIAGAVGVGNAVLQFLLTPIRNVVDAVKGMGAALKNVFKGDFKQAAEDAKKAAKDIGENFKKGFNFQENFEEGKKVGEQFIAGLGSAKVKQDAKQAGKDVAQEFLKSLENEIIVEEDFSKVFVWDPDGEVRRQNQELFDDLIKQRDAYDAEMAKRAEWERKAEENNAEHQKQLLRERSEVMMAYGAAASSVFGSIADIYEADADANEQTAKQAKALRTAAAIIDTISGAVAAYRSTMESFPAPVAMALAPINAATVLAAGYAQVRQINAVKVGGSGGGGMSLPAAPAYTASVPQVRTVTTASERQTFDRMADRQRVYILASDLQAERSATRVKIDETSF